MALAMSRPWKHPKTGIYWLRRRVPQEMVALVGRTQVTRSLETRDPAEAKTRLVKALAEFDAQWAALKRGPLVITEREAHSFAAKLGETWLAEHRDNPSEQVLWRTALHERLWNGSYMGVTLDVPDGASEEDGEQAFKDFADSSMLQIMHHFCFKQADEFLARFGYATDWFSRQKVARAIAESLQRSTLILEKEARGIYEPGTEPTTICTLAGRTTADARVSASEHRARRAPTNMVSKVSLRGLIDEWWREAQAGGRKPSTYESYSNTFSNLERFLGHNDATRVTPEDVIRFKDFRLTTPSAKTGRVASAKTVKGTDLTALKTVFGWAVTNRRLPENPAADVGMKVGKKPRLRSKSFTEAESKAILQKAFAHRSDREIPQTAAGKKWVPWLCALTGARVGEMAQLRKQDFREWSGRWVVRITPEAGTVKTNEAREVVLHSQLVELGLIDFVQEAPDGPLFLRPDKQGDVTGPLQALKNRLAEFARGIVSDPNVAPTHGHRHRFKTVGMEVGVAPRVLDAIEGHVARTAGDSYGDVTLPTIAAAIDKFPHIELSDVTSFPNPASESGSV